MATDTESYAPGQPNWVDLGSPDLEGSKAFYCPLLGWEAYTVPDPSAGGYTMFMRDGKTVAGLGPLMSPDQPPAWNIYIASDDADATAGAVTEAGGTVVAGPFDVLGQGRMAVFTDPAGAFISIWEPQAHRGSEVRSGQGSIAWTELATRDMGAAQQFYRQVFGWDTRTNDMGGFQYTEWLLGDRSIAGGVPMNDQFPPEVPSYWTVYFATADAEATATQAQDLGATLLVAPQPIEGVGTYAVLRDPQGAVFGILGP